MALPLTCGFWWFYAVNEIIAVEANENLQKLCCTADALKKHFIKIVYHVEPV